MSLQQDLRCWKGVILMATIVSKGKMKCAAVESRLHVLTKGYFCTCKTAVLVASTGCQALQWSIEAVPTARACPAAFLFPHSTYT